MGFFGQPKAKEKTGTRIFFSTDVHGSTLCFKKFINAADFYEADILVLGGDVTGKMVVPIVRQVSGHHTSSFAGRDLELDSEEDVRSFEQRITNMGLYPKVMEVDEFQGFSGDPERQEELFRQLALDRLREWIAYAEDRLAGRDLPVFAAPGNDDFYEVDEVFEESDRIELLEMRVHRLTDDHEIVTTGWSNRTPWDTERECDEAELARRLDEMISQVENMETCVFNLHVPPHDSKIDYCPKLDENLQVVSEMGNQVWEPAGSTAVREAIERHGPMLSLHGHIHEGRGDIRIGRTLCINPGSVYSDGVLYGTLINLTDRGIDSYEFTQG